MRTLKRVTAGHNAILVHPPHRGPCHPENKLPGGKQATMGKKQSTGFYQGQHGRRGFAFVFWGDNETIWCIVVHMRMAWLVMVES
jgi:hypothetical protein